MLEDKKNQLIEELKDVKRFPVNKTSASIILRMIYRLGAMSRHQSHIERMRPKEDTEDLLKEEFAQLYLQVMQLAQMKEYNMDDIHQLASDSIKSKMKK